MMVSAEKASSYNPAEIERTNALVAMALELQAESEILRLL
jgi:hypothetical protein